MDLRSKCVGCVGALVVAAACGGCGREAPPEAPAVTINGRTWQVELALTVEQRYRGLSDREQLDANAGMLFVYPTPQILDFCMRQCVIPLDVAFIGADQRVVKTCTMPVEPYGLERAVYSSDTPVQYALEVRAGALAEAGVKRGDRVDFSPGVPAAAKADPGP